jgi:septal ring factor EnvC (AmiA/AmiB activator)
MKLYNQGKERLAWSMGGRDFKCQPYGEVEVPQELLLFVKSRGLPLDATPVPAEVKASQQAQYARREAEGAEVVTLKRQLAEMRAAEAEAKKALETSAAQTKDLSDRLELANMEVDELKGKVATLEAEKSALAKQLSEQAKLLAELEAETAPKKPAAKK